jgi:hypothetical protein
MDAGFSQGIKAEGKRREGGSPLLTTYLDGSDSGNNEAGEGDDHLEAFLGLEGGEIFLHRSEVLSDEGGEGLSNFGGYLVRAPKRAAMVLSFGLVHEVYFWLF